MHRIFWQLAKFGMRLIRRWAKDQYDIDGDYVQVSEILDEWFGDLR